MTIRLQAPGLGWTGEWLDVPAVYEDEDDRSSGFPKRVSYCRENCPLIEYAKAPVFVRLMSESLLTPKKSAASFVLSVAEVCMDSQVMPSLPSGFRH